MSDPAPCIVEYRRQRGDPETWCHLAIQRRYLDWKVLEPITFQANHALSQTIARALQSAPNQEGIERVRTEKIFNACQNLTLLIEAAKHEAIGSHGLLDEFIAKASPYLNAVSPEVGPVLNVATIDRVSKDWQATLLRSICTGFQYKGFFMADPWLDKVLIEVFRVSPDDYRYIFTTHGQAELDEEYAGSLGADPSTRVWNNGRLNMGKWIVHTTSTGAESVRLLSALWEAMEANQLTVGNDRRVVSLDHIVRFD